MFTRPIQVLTINLTGFLRGLTAMLAVTVMTPTLAAGPETLEAFSARLRTMYPATRIDAVSIAPVAGLYEVTMGKNVAYVDGSGRYFLFGHVWDMPASKDLTAGRREQLDLVDVASLPKSLAITHVRGNGQRVLYVLADPQCGYCRQLEKTLDDMNDTTVHTFVLPILGPESKRLAQNIWCAPNRDRAWRDWMLKGITPPQAAASCESPAAAVERLAGSLGMTSTPSLVAADGRKHAGALQAAELSDWLAAGGTSSVASSTTSPVSPKTAIR